MLAADPISIEIAGEAYQLRPSLLAATRLARRYGDFAKLYQVILSDHFTAAVDVIREGSGDRHAAADFTTGTELFGIRHLLDTLKLPLLRFVLQLAGHDEGAADAKRTGRTMPFAEYHAELFRIGTGWLGWTPEATWHATPAEIVAAHAGRVDMLKAIYGTADKPDAPAEPRPLVLNDDGTDAEFDRAAFRALKERLRAA